MTQALFQTQRSRMIAAFNKAGQDYLANTTPYQSTKLLRFDVVNYNQGAARPYGYAVARAGQTLDFFSYGVGQQWATIISSLGAAATNIPLMATEAETNLGKEKSTNGAQDFVIEGIGFHSRGFRFAAGPFPGAPGSNNLEFDDYVAAGQTADPDVAAALQGTAIVADPGGIITPPQLMSPFNLEQALTQAVIGYMSLEFEWDRRRTEKITVADLLPQAGAASYLRANGEPCSANKYRIPEGYLWRRDGQPDSELVARMTLRQPIVVPLDLITTPADAGETQTPGFIYLECVMRLFGLSLALPSAN